MGQKSYLKVAGIRGSSPDVRHLGEIEVDNFKYVDGGKSRIKSRVLMQTNADAAYVQFLDKMVKNEKIKDAILTVETRDNLDRIYQLYKVEMKGVMVTDVKLRSSTFESPRESARQIQTVTFSVDSVEISGITPRPGLDEEWKI